MTTKITVRPNPFVNSITLEITTPYEKHGIVRLVDEEGKIIRMLSWNLKQGINATSINALGKLNGGTYLLDVIEDDGQVMYETKLVKN